MSVARLSRRLAVVAALMLGARMLPAEAGDVAAYALLGVLPGLVLAERLLPRAGAFARACVALTAAPITGAVLGVALRSAGPEGPEAVAFAARALAWGAAAAWVLAGLLPARPAEEPEEPPVPRGVWWIALGLSAAVALVPILNPFIAVRGDSWTHGAITIRVLEGGLPPEDPRFAAIPVRYVWLYNVFVALLCGLRDRPPFAFMVMLNVATAFATVGLTALAALRLWRRAPASGPPARAALGATALLVFGLNAGMWLLWPVHLARALTGEVRGSLGIEHAFAGVELGWARVIYNLSAPFAYMVSFLDKLLVGSPLAYGYLLMILHLWSLQRWLELGRRGDLFWMALAAAGMMLVHGVVALSVIPVWLGTLALALLLRARLPWLPPAGRLIGAALATLAGGLAATPYMISVASGWSAAQTGVRHQFISPDPLMLWTIATACLFALWFARRPLIAAWRERSPTASLLALYLVAMLAFSALIRLPENNQTKFVFQVFVPALLLAAPAFAAWVERQWRAHRVRTAVVLALLFAAPSALTLHGYVADPGRRIDPYMIESEAEAALNRWIRERTPRGAIVVDHRFRDLLLVRGRRALYLGSDKGPQWAAFPLDQVLERRRVAADLYGAAADLPGDAGALARFGRPLYVVFRPEDDGETAAAWAAVRGDPARFEPVYDHDGYRVVRLIGAGAGT